jgi:hypothetical protein
MSLGQAARLAQVLLVGNVGASVKCVLKIDTYFDSPKLIISPLKVLC